MLYTTSKIKHYELVMEDRYQNDKDLIKELTNKLKEKGFSVQDSITFKNIYSQIFDFGQGLAVGPELLFLHDDTFYKYYPTLKLLKEIIDSNKIYMPFLFNLAYGIIYGESTDSIVSDTIESVTQEVANIGKIWEAIRELSNTEGSAIQELISFLDNNVANKPERVTKCVNLSCKRVKLPMLKMRMDPPELSDEEQNLEAASNDTFEFSIFLHIWPHLEKGELASTVLTSLEKEDFNVTFEKDQLHINSKLKFDVSRMGEDTTGKDGHTDARQGLIEYGETYFGERITLVPETIEIGETIKIGEKYYTLNMSYQVAVFKYISRIERGVRLYISLIPGSGNGAHKSPNNILEIKSLRSLGASAFSDIICRRLEIEEGSNKNVNFSISLGGALYLSDFGLTPREELPLSGFVSLCDSSELPQSDNSSWVELSDTEAKENPLMTNKSDASTDDVSKS